MVYLHINRRSSKEFKMQQRAQLIFRESKFCMHACHISPLLHSLYWLPVKQSIYFKILLPMHLQSYPWPCLEIHQLSDNHMHQESGKILFVIRRKVECWYQLLKVNHWHLWGKGHSVLQQQRQNCGTEECSSRRFTNTGSLK